VAKAQELVGNFLLDASSFSGGVKAPTTTIFFKGPQIAGTAISFFCPGNGWLVGVSASGSCIVTRNRIWTSLAASTWAVSSVIAGVPSLTFLQLRERCLARDVISVDSAGGLGSGDHVSLYFEFD
jgi:hypothetical protein